MIFKLAGEGAEAEAEASCLWKSPRPSPSPSLPLAGAVWLTGGATGGPVWAGGEVTKTKPELMRPSGWQPSRGVPEVTVWF